MTEHIDLGRDLAEYTGGGGRPPAPVAQERPRSLLSERLKASPEGMQSIPLAELQAQGFNRTPPPGYAAEKQRREIMSGWVLPADSFDIRKWWGLNDEEDPAPPEPLKQFPKDPPSYLDRRRPPGMSPEIYRRFFGGLGHDGDIAPGQG